ncbi:aldehyde ferredoxin oxidoreductase N-terminal domain-containing protein [Shewanella pealeana]|uniref:Aldehyde ferredoxin oxidoreductase n=1 Tax=Shewanella pealeana (strain ATCC 700345 / ANG-SQ1) TaxID=398579 RepID=A8GZ52_SHEPA|nr:aldehyde ferredoxin oxidoreductase N-terminal domain-containing protein [Shewanella pealeana]ABV85589.1 Aldehyde ferredoxin oxidoreductase [Shewanella pealeana ATCC 700345]
MKKLKGYAGKILHIDLNNMTHHVLPTEDYYEWGGGHGFGAKLFWDLCEDIEAVIDGRDPRNVITIAGSPFSGTNVPSAGGRCEVTNVSVGLIPRNRFTRSNFGGHFSSMMKHAGWDAITITGKAPYPVYIDVRNHHVMIRDASHLWGKDTHETQQFIQENVAKIDVAAGWNAQLDGNDIGRTTQKASVLAIGPAGENQAALGCLIHGAGNAAGQGGNGAVFGSKNLKAISFIGTGSVDIADPAALVKARFKTREFYAVDVDKSTNFTYNGLSAGPAAITFSQMPTEHRASSCHGCVNGCKQRNAIGYGNEVTCQTSVWYLGAVRSYKFGGDAKLSLHNRSIDLTADSLYAGDLANRLGINTYAIMALIPWMQKLHAKGKLGVGKKIDSNLPYEILGSREFADKFCHAIATGTDIGAHFLDGVVPGVQALGHGADVDNGTLDYPYYGMPEHGYDTRAELEWGYATLMTDRDMNDHALNWIYWTVNLAKLSGIDLPIPAKEMATCFVEKMAPYIKPDEVSAMDYASHNMYSEVLARQVQWVNHYGRFWKNSALMCDFRWPDCVNLQREDLRGATGNDEVGEHVWWNAVTGEDISYVDGIERGRRILNLDNAIWVLEGRHRDDAKFADYIYDKKLTYSKLPTFLWPATNEAGEWDYRDMLGRSHCREGVETWKSHYYRAEGWDPDTGWPTRALLESMNMKEVADRLEQVGKLGKEG